MPSLSFHFPLPLQLLLFCTFLFFSSAMHSFHDDRQSLLAFKKLITSDPYDAMADWNDTNISISNWTGVTCSRRHPNRVLALNLTDMDLYGPISPFLGNLSFLHSLDLSGNALQGLIPTQLGCLSRLRTLRLNHNQLEGHVPTQLSGCKNLVSLVLSFNNLSGKIPRELCSLTHLQYLALGTNRLTGNIPSSLGNLSALFHLTLELNSLTGAIPPQLGLLTSLQIVYLSANELSGSIPISLSNISTLTVLDIGLNKLNGTMPQELGFLTNLNFLYLWGNQLSGNIPIFIGNCSNLKLLSLGQNMLSGSVPLELGKLSLLKKLHLPANDLDSGTTTTMPFLVALTNCSQLQELSLRNNKISGVLPLDIGHLSTNLSYLSLGNNRIKGNIPPHIGNLTSLYYLNLSINLLTGNIPPLGNLKMIEQLCLSNNRLEGNILDDFEQLQHLGLLDISENNLSGRIPNSLAPLKQLRRVLLHHNQLSRSIPTSLGSCLNLELLDLSHNMLTGSIPREIAKLYNLQFYLNLSWNLLEGSLPLEIGKIAMAQAIDISSNRLTGAIPPTLGSCSELQSLNLSQNSFQSSIPDSFEKLQSLLSLDLSSNSLSGTIPITLEKLKMLQFLNLSFNHLTGEIPKGGIFANQTSAIFLIGNLGLCGPHIFNLSACPTPRSHFPFVKRILLPIIGALVFILCCLLLVYFWKGNIHMENFDFSQAIFQKLVHQRISYQELHIATNGFSNANLLGRGNYGLVYKGILSDGSFVAVKVLQLQNQQVEKSFKAECSVLQKVRHRNLVRVITSCSNLQFKALVFEFMPKGSLENHLYPDRDDNNDEVLCELRLKTRLDIAIDVAHAMEYLHHDSFVQVVHCDIKPSNVLLDEDMSGHVTDFGIARLIGATSNDSLTSSLALKGSMGYIAPEYGLAATISTKGDVYSFGILLLEMLTRKRPTSDMFVGELNLHKWVNLAFPNRVKEVIDELFFEEVDEYEFEENNIYNCLLSLLHVGLSCSKDSPEERPTMREVAMVLESIRKDLMATSVPSQRLRRSISNLLSNTNEASNVAFASNDQSSSTI
eukprot:PITA_19174